jgi:basic amino acid/polyamine antiporter, APA family
MAVPILRRSRAAGEGAFALPGGPLIPLLAVALSAWLLTGVSTAQAVAGRIALASGALVYAAVRAIPPETAAPAAASSSQDDDDRCP